MADKEAVVILTSEDLDLWANFKRENYDSIDLTYAKLSNLNVSRLDLSSCDLDGAYFDDCDLRGCDFSHASLRNAKFRKCILSRARFFRAALMSVEFDRCEIDGVDFSNSYDLTDDAIKTSYFDSSTIFPSSIDRDDDWYDDIDDADDDEQPAAQSRSEKRQDGSVDSGAPHSHVPTIHERIIAPLETVWRNDILYVDRPDNFSNVNTQVQSNLLRGLRNELDRLCASLDGTNFDQRIVSDLRTNLNNFPATARDFRRKTIPIWFSFRPIFEYTNITKGQHSDYLEAKIISFQMNLRDVLLTYDEFRQFERESQAVNFTENFNYAKFLAAQIEFSQALGKQPASIDSDVARGIDSIVDLQSRIHIDNPPKYMLYGAAASAVNIISRIFLRVIKEFAAGAADGIKENTKSLVSSCLAAGGGAVLLWLISTGLTSFTWLRNAWTFVKNVLNL